MMLWVTLISILVCCGLFFFLYKNHEALKATTKELEEQKNKALQIEQSSSLAEEKMKLIEELRKKEEDQLKIFEKQLTLQFENLSQKIFEEKSSQFKKDSKEQFNHLLNPFKEKFTQFQQKVDTYYETESKERFSLKNEIEKLILTGNKMQAETQKLSQAIQGDIQSQGNLGELILNRILEKSGLREGREFIAQGKNMNLKSNEGQVLKPDIVVHLPRDRHLIIDSKVSLTNYLQFYEEKSSEDKQKQLKNFITSIKTHIKNLSSKNYQDALKINSIDFVFLFFPYESAFSLALKEEPFLQEVAWKEKIVIVSPATLMSALRTVYLIWQKEKERKNVFEISRAAGGLYDKFVGFMGDFQQIKQNLDKSSRSYELAWNKLKSGKGNIISKLEHIKELGAQSKKTLPSNLAQDSEEGVDTASLASKDSYFVVESQSSDSKTSLSSESSK